ncbi:MAG: DUF1214 domain-containing protein [Beijerinckiaceae bacterium]
MTTLFRFVLTALAGTLLGLAATYFVLQSGPWFGRIEVGPWLVAHGHTSAEIDPYARAAFARTGEVPLAPAEGVTFLARTDSAGDRLEPRCNYVLSGQVPASRYWSLTLVTPSGALVDNPAKRYGFTSAEILRAADGSFEIVISSHARPGNWLPAATPQAFNLVLRLYDTLLDFGTSPLDKSALPQIRRGACE